MANTTKHGGGANTNKHGKSFEHTTDLIKLYTTELYNIFEVIDEKGNFLWYKIYDETVDNGIIYLQQHKFYKYLSTHKIKYRNLSSKFIPDGCLINEKEKYVIILEMKFQSSSGSADEKITTCSFKQQQYEKLFKQKGYDVYFVFILHNWFVNKKYKDHLEYIDSAKNCMYFFEIFPKDLLMPSNEYLKKYKDTKYKKQKINNKKMAKEHYNSNHNTDE